MKKVILASAALLTASTLILSGCKKEDDPDPVVPTPTGPSLPQSSAVVFYTSLDGNSAPGVGSAADTAYAVTYGNDRFGNAQKAAVFNGSSGGAGTGSVIEYTSGNFINPSTTISVWYKLDLSTPWTGGKGMFGYAATRGYFFEMSDNQAWCKFTSSHMLNPDPSNFNFAGSDMDPNGDGTLTNLITYDYHADFEGSPTMQTVMGGDGVWHNLVMTYDASTSVKTIYIDNRKMMQMNISYVSEDYQMRGMALGTHGAGDVPNTGYINKLVLGAMAARGTTDPDWSNPSANTNTFKGSLDDFRIWNVALTESEVAALYDYEN